MKLHQCVGLVLSDAVVLHENANAGLCHLCSDAFSASRQMTFKAQPTETIQALSLCTLVKKGQPALPAVHVCSSVQQQQLHNQLFNHTAEQHFVHSMFVE